jgi:phosphate:Na+ symporter
MDMSSAMTILGGIGLFLLGIHHLTDGLKGLAGDALRQALQTLVRGRLSAVAFGALFTALIQSSTATVMTVIGFVSAGLVTFPQAIGVLIGATFGTTTTPWMVAFFGFRVQIASFAMPMVGVGAFLWLIARGRTRAFGAILAGFGLIFIGLDYLQTGMGAVSWNIDSFVGDGWAAKWLLAGLGVVMTVVMQSSSAAAAATLVALHAGNVDFLQACAMVVGQSVGTAATSAALGAMSGGLAVRRAATAHVIFSLVVGVLGMLLLAPLARAAIWSVSALDDYDGVLGLAAFSSLFKLMGVVVFFPWLDRYARFITDLTGKGTETAVNRLAPTLAETGGPVALEAAYRALDELSRVAVDAVRGRLDGENVVFEPPQEDLRQVERFIETMSLETLDSADMEPRLVRLVHAIDHLKQLHEDLQKPQAASEWPPLPAAGAGAKALRDWLESGADKTAALREVEATAGAIADQRRTAREEILAAVARQQTGAAAADVALQSLQWSDEALQRSWRLLKSLHLASGR